jgi:serine phosphatase RsbU (regulator of sigma subunit)/CHASE2 domain-containing sensor protein
MAELVSAIAAGRPLTIGLDVFFPEPDRFSPTSVAGQIKGLSPEIVALLRSLPSSDAVLGEALKEVPVVLGVAGLQDPDPRFAGAPPGPPVRLEAGVDGERLRRFGGHLTNVAEIEAGAASHGIYNVDLEDGVARRLMLLARFDAATLPALGIEMVRLAAGGPLSVGRAAGGLIELRFGVYAVPAQPDGHAYLRFSHHDPNRFVSAADVISGSFDASQFEGKLVLVGFEALGLQDRSITPLGENVPAVENHAQLIEAIIEGEHLRRFANAPRIEAALLLAFGLMLFWFIPRANAQRSAFALVAGAAILFGAALAAFRAFGLLFDPFGPVIGAIFVFGVMQAGTLAEAERQRRQLREQAARMSGELDAAKRIQMGLLPDPREVFAKERRFSLAALLEPARTVGGDFYDCFLLDERRLFFVVADVSGKGLPASLFMASAKSILKSAALTVKGSVGGILARAQDEIQLENPESLFVTALAGVLDVETGELELANAGHEPAWAKHPRGLPERLEVAGGPPLCVMEVYSYPATRRTLARGEWLLVLSDGATEAMNGAREFFGFDRLRTSLGWLGDEASAEEIVGRIRDDVLRFEDGAEPADDLTLLAIRWNGPSAVNGR